MDISCFLAALFTAALGGCGSNRPDDGVSSTGGVGAGGTRGPAAAGMGGATTTSTLVSAGGAGGNVPSSSSSCTFVDGGTPPAVGAVTGLEFSAASGIPSNPAPPVHVVVTDAAKAQDAYAATLALPVFPPGTYACPAD
jgi:hypothetical protein